AEPFPRWAAQRRPKGNGTAVAQSFQIDRLRSDPERLRSGGDPHAEGLPAAQGSAQVIVQRTVFIRISPLPRAGVATAIAPYPLSIILNEPGGRTCGMRFAQLIRTVGATPGHPEPIDDFLDGFSTNQGDLR